MSIQNEAEGETFDFSFQMRRQIIEYDTDSETGIKIKIHFKVLVICSGILVLDIPVPHHGCMCVHLYCTVNSFQCIYPAKIHNQS